MSAQRSRSGSLGSPLQKIAMGLVIVLLEAPFPPHPSPSWERYDFLPNPIGWALVIAGTWALARANPVFAPHRWLAATAGAVSVPLWFPQVQHGLDASGQWFTSLPQIAFCLWLAREIGIQGAQQDPPDDYAPKRFGLMVWGSARSPCSRCSRWAVGSSASWPRRCWSRRWSTSPSPTTCSGCTAARGWADRDRWRSTPRGPTPESRPPSS